MFAGALRFSPLPSILFRSSGVWLHLPKWGFASFGLRKEEALALEKRHFDFEQKKLFIEQAFTYRHNQPELSVTKSVSGERILPLAEEDIRFFPECLQGDKNRFPFRQ